MRKLIPGGLFFIGYCNQQNGIYAGHCFDTRLRPKQKANMPFVRGRRAIRRMLNPISGKIALHCFERRGAGGTKGKYAVDYREGIGIGQAGRQTDSIDPLREESVDSSP
ncbi:hypothetical protein [Gorillibacterium sp. sgz5001074]|uniref:hypothetical protein n=1 Tax=Gorillibacterium sp. sgz5001074 TaxID=3446695 RepID=UPI003F66B374